MATEAWTPSAISAVVAAVAATVSAVVALAAVIVGSRVQRHIADRQITAQLEITGRQIDAQVLSANRVVWIAALREHVAQLLTLALLIEDHVKHGEPDSAEFARRTARADLKNERIRLLLNPNEPGHRELEILLHQLVLGIAERPMHVERVHNSRRGIRSQTRAILKEEWERTKAVK